MIHEYPYTNFNEYNLDWCVGRIRDLTKEWAETHQEWEDTKTEWESYKNYIDNYFSNLDLSQEVSDKIDQMAEDGYFVDLFNTVFRSDIMTEAGNITSAWIQQNLLQETGYVIDKSLTVADAAADAEVVGIRLSRISENTANLYRNLDPDISVSSTYGYRLIMLDDPLPAGNYTLCCKYTTDATGKRSKIQFSSSQTPMSVPGNTIVGEGTFPIYDSTTDGWCYVNMTLSATAYQIRALAATTTSGSAGLSAYFSNFMILSGHDADINYIKPDTATDWKYRGTHLSPTGDTTDRTDEIERALKEYGRVTLDPGEYTVYRLLMPEGTVLEGSGYNTIVYLKDTANADDYAIRMHENTEIMNMCIKGTHDVSDISISGNQTGLLFSGSTRKKAIIQNCWIEDFDSCGIVLYDTTTNVDQNTLIDNCFISTCHIGILIKANSEFHKISNCNVNKCYFGILNRGGNNIITNCGIDGNVTGIQIDADEGSNNGHGSISNCTINHSNNNTGYGLIIQDTGRMLINNCNIHYSNILIDNSDGNIISNCGFGNSANVEITGGNCTLMIGCMIRSNLNTITKNAASKVISCYYRDGSPVTV